MLYESSSCTALRFIDGLQSSLVAAEPASGMVRKLTF